MYTQSVTLTNTHSLTHSHTHMRARTCARTCTHTHTHTHTIIPACLFRNSLTRLSPLCSHHCLADSPLSPLVRACERCTVRTGVDFQRQRSFRSRSLVLDSDHEALWLDQNSGRSSSDDSPLVLKNVQKRNRDLNYRHY